MINELQNKEILTLAAQGARPAEIAEALGAEEAMVNLVLSAHNQASDRDITDEQLSLLRARAFSLAMQGEDLTVSARMTQYLIDRDRPKAGAQGSPITAINNAIILANERVAELAKEYAPVSNGKP